MAPQGEGAHQAGRQATGPRRGERERASKQGSTAGRQPSSLASCGSQPCQCLASPGGILFCLDAQESWPSALKTRSSQANYIFKSGRKMSFHRKNWTALSRWVPPPLSSVLSPPHPPHPFSPAGCPLAWWGGGGAGAGGGRERLDVDAAIQPSGPPTAERGSWAGAALLRIY